MPEIEVKVKGYKCNNCSYEWLPRSNKEKPLICPKCKSARWDLPKKYKEKGLKTRKD
jgi:predicted Zn-ribbon and HTH transcriptional regulator